MGLFDNKNASGDICMTLEITAGKENLNLSFLTNKVSMAQREDGLVYFDSLPDRLFRLTDYVWSGPTYKTVTTGIEKGKHKGKEKSKNKGGLGGAVIGTIFWPVTGAGAIIGYSMSKKNVKKNKGRSTVKTTMSENQLETDNQARIQVEDVSTGASFSIGVKCNSKIDVDLDRFDWSSLPDSEEDEANARQTASDKIQLIKEYKDLLDMGVISQEEFDQKKQELLG